MLFMPVGTPKPMRVQGCFVSNREVESVVQYLKNAEDHEYDDKVAEEIERQAAAAARRQEAVGRPPPTVRMRSIGDRCLRRSKSPSSGGVSPVCSSGGCGWAMPAPGG